MTQRYRYDSESYRSSATGRSKPRNAGPVSIAQAGARGFGLGLSIVRAVARAHGGTAEAQPRPAGGLIVTVTLPPA